MTDRHAGYIVVLEKPIREDDAESVLNAIRMTKGVISVKPIVNNVSLEFAHEKARLDILGAIHDVLKKESERY